MGFWDQENNLNKKGRAGAVRLEDDKAGTYWFKIDLVDIESKTQAGDTYVKIAKTTLKVVDDADGRAHDVGTETSTVIFYDKKYDGYYFTRDVRNLVMVGHQLSPNVVNEFTLRQLGDKLTELEGLVLEAAVDVKAKKNNPEEAVITIRWLRQINDNDVATLPTDVRKRYGIDVDADEPPAKRRGRPRKKEAIPL